MSKSALLLMLTKKLVFLREKRVVTCLAIGVILESFTNHASLFSCLHQLKGVYALKRPQENPRWPPKGKVA